MNDNPSFLVVCSHCGTTNRVPAVRLADDPECGKCHQLLLSGKPIELNDSNFTRLTADTEIPVVVDFWAPWCGPCRNMAPHFEQAASQLKGKVIFAKVNSDESPQTAQRFAIRSIPTMVKLAKGEEVKRSTGSIPAAQIVAFAG